MAHHERLGEDIVCIDTEQHRLGMAACYLIGNAGHYAFVDTGTSLSTPLLLDTLVELDIARAQVDYVMPTHVHLDHAGGAGALMQALPNARLVVHPRGARHLIDPARLVAGAIGVYGEQAVRAMYGEVVPVTESRVIVADVAADKDFELSLGNRRLSFIDAPGHARHHYAVWDAASRGWFSGDTFGVSYREFDTADGNFLLPTTTPVQFDPPAWLESLQRMLARDPQWMYLTHFGRVGDIPALAVKLQDDIAAYQRIALEHRDRPDRHARIQAALADYHIEQLAKLDHPMSVARARELLELDVKLNAQGLEVWLDRPAQAAS